MSKSQPKRTRGRPPQPLPKFVPATPEEVARELRKGDALLARMLNTPKAKD